MESIKDILQLNLTFQPRFEKTSNCNISNSVNEPSYMTCMNHPHDVEDDMDMWHNIINTKLFNKRHVLVSYIMLCHILLDMPLPKICSIEKHVLTKKQKIQMQIKVYNSPCLSWITLNPLDENHNNNYCYTIVNYVVKKINKPKCMTEKNPNVKKTHLH